MFNTNNQTTTVNYRWRQDGDVTPMPRALYNTGFNFQGSSRYVESGSFVRFNNLRLSYNFDRKVLKRWGLSALQVYFSMNNLWLWTKYSGIDGDLGRFMGRRHRQLANPAIQVLHSKYKYWFLKALTI